MRWTQTFIPTLKETPADAEIMSHKLLLRAGLVRKLTGGLYTFLPLAVLALRKVEQIVREEMNRAGAIEVLMPALQPVDIWQQSGRYESANAVLFKVRDGAKKEWVLGPTHEEVITTLASAEISSYRQMPINFYQIQTKFRDELRPRFGLMRAKEFIMKDAYSFDSTDDLALVSYRKMYDAYARIFKRCGLKAIPVEADMGVIGGKFSHEFMVPAESGENEVAYCEGCNYAANVEKAASRGPAIPTHKGQPPSGAPHHPEKFPTPGVKTIEGLAKMPHNVPAERQIKTLVYVADSKPVLLLLRGDDRLNESKLAVALGTGNFRPSTAEEIVALLSAHPGSLGAVHVTKIAIYADSQLSDAMEMTTGANEDGFHFRNVAVNRDIGVAHWVDLRTVREAEACPNCGKPLKIQRAIEVGHVFKLGTNYSEKLNALFLDETGKQQPAIMGCYGIGITRTLQAVIEQCHDKDGIIWPLSVAPYRVCLTPLSITPGGPVMTLAEKIYNELTARGADVIMDDRDERPGVKFKDSELIGFPIRLGIGEKSLAKGEVELKPRGGVLMPVKADDAVSKIMELLAKPAA